MVGGGIPYLGADEKGLSQGRAGLLAPQQCSIARSPSPSPCCDQGMLCHFRCQQAMVRLPGRAGCHPGPMGQSPQLCWDRTLLAQDAGTQTAPPTSLCPPLSPDIILGRAVSFCPAGIRYHVSPCGHGSPVRGEQEALPHRVPAPGELGPVPGSRDTGVHEAGERAAHRLLQDPGHRAPLPGGGNAGMATAYAARKLGLPATVVVPSSTSPSTVSRLKELGATVEVYGKVWDEANQRALELVQNEDWASIHPFDDPLLWQGHASLVLELKDTLDTKPDAIVLAVGGGGLLAGVVAGLQQVGWLDVPIIAAETWGAHSFHAALKAGHLITLPDITSVAKCLGAKTVSARALQCAQEIQVISEVVEDAEAVHAVERFLDDERMLVQPACGAALALFYSKRLQQLQREGRLRTPLGRVVVVVCGGSSMTAALLRDLKNQLGLE
uniref:L-serine deaminase n=1 Tax=Coturnix japonica TaxID=93934 RepID=A0A8C2TV23_COTJA